MAASSASNTRLNEACSLLVQSPPGQTSQVYHDLRGILFDAESNAADKIDDAKLQAAAAVALQEYNTQQLVTATLDADASGSSANAVVICQAGQAPNQPSDAQAAPGVRRYIHPRLQKTFLFDHIKRTVSDVQDLEPADEEAEEQRKALEKALDEYVRDRYPDGVSSVFAVSSAPVHEAETLAESVQKAAESDASAPAENTAAVSADKEDKDDEPSAESDEAAADDKDDPVAAVEAAEAVESSSAAAPAAAAAPRVPVKTTYVLHHVGNRYNLSNFWSGRWRASYVVDVEARVLTASLGVHVHYFENGNVQLNASRPRTFSLTSSGAAAIANEVATLVAQHEDAWQAQLEQAYDQLAEHAFKALRRQLPLTRQKLDWDKVLNYKLGDQLARS
ncbi:subunits of heterodimeric actin filament capping protein Capz [Moesziomyces antarcticus]|uniref:Related to CAP1 - F-actin capping protein alpha subunit n=1 Tax=Pseudozyma antarctica TaxID=84753 RepID=A0A5C3FHC5_PSEA2|nr:subunits of heterodimeric actin filament capping protein Capz [Moesziomyces antarcticus]GAK62243.1 subunits of heterodimeric actin filament capping protein Capz [Moesziomyces antarcticus]SPO42779.1 related to CAP1 - F-actin capping protein alpha subunit [Moesziomyces antarcticus]